MFLYLLHCIGLLELPFCVQMSNILYYEILDIPLPELQGLITLRVAFHHATHSEVVCTKFCDCNHFCVFEVITLLYQVLFHIIRLPKGSTFSALIEDLKSKVNSL